MRSTPTDIAGSGIEGFSMKKRKWYTTFRTITERVLSVEQKKTTTIIILMKTNNVIFELSAGADRPSNVLDPRHRGTCRHYILRYARKFDIYLILLLLYTLTTMSVFYQQDIFWLLVFRRLCQQQPISWEFPHHRHSHIIHTTHTRGVDIRYITLVYLYTS